MSKDTPRTAKAGEELAAKAVKRLTGTFPHMRDLLVGDGLRVQPKSDAKSGQWGCVDCGEMLQNNMSAQGHNAKHRLAWWVGLHFEEP